MKREHQLSSGNCTSSSKSKMWSCETDDGGVDELFAALGYMVKSTDMAAVAQRIEHLEEVMGNVQQASLSQLASETVHYNPSDLSSWLDSMISDFNPDPFLESPPNSVNVNSHAHQILPDSDFGSDLFAVPGESVYSGAHPLTKKLRTSPSVPFSDDPVFDRTVGPLVLVDSQENGVRLVHTLMACAEAVHQENLELAEILVKNIGFLAFSQAGAMRKVATYFAEALARRIYRLCPVNPQEATFTDMLEMYYYETCPYLKFAHFTANQAILEAFAGKPRVHVIDFGMKQGMQWPALLQAMALRPGGPPRFRLTGIGPPSSDDTDHLQEIGLRLAQLAETINIEFEYRGFVANSLADLDPSLFNIRECEVVAVNSIFELHQLLAIPGAVEKVLQVVKELKPEIVTVVEQEANHNGSSFLDRFTESLHYYSTLFDSLESCGTAADGSVSNQDKVMSEVYLGRQICNVVACEGSDRIERHDTLCQWRARFGTAGFGPVHLGSNAYKQASMLLALFAGGDGYRVEENSGCLLLGWHTRPLIATSAWKLG